jgi:hypothetical protein
MATSQSIQYSTYADSFLLDYAVATSKNKIMSVGFQVDVLQGYPLINKALIIKGEPENPLHP